MPSSAALESLRGEFRGNVFRDVDGFLAKYFEHKLSSATLQHMMQAEAVSKLSVDVIGLDHFDALEEWLTTLQSLFISPDQTNLRFRSQQISKPGFPLSASIYLETVDVQAITGSTRVLGEYHQASAMTDDDSDFLCFCAHVGQVFNAQSARRFLHAFLIRGTTLELWVFDRSGAYSSEKFDLAQKPGRLVQTLAGYIMMSDEEAGLNTFVKHLGSDGFVTFGQRDKLYLRPKLIAAPDYIVGLGTTCYAASQSTTGEPGMVVKFSWREGPTHAEIQQLERARVIQLLGDEDLVSVADLRHGLRFPQPFVNRTLSCVATAPLGRPIQKFTSITELLEVLRDLVKALRSLYVDGRILHRDIAIKNLIIPTQHSTDSPRGVLIDFDQAPDLDNVRAVEPLVGSDGFMAVGILSGRPHTYRHDLESLFYVLLWFAIGNDRENAEANDILEGLPKTSRLWKWCSMDFAGIGRDKATDMSPEGFLGILDEFSADFAPLRGLAKELHALLFPVRDGKIFTGTETEQAAVERLYSNMADAFNRSALVLLN
ncbi:hypothetical protein N0V84_005035 [Fusarium piperis]|uniref:EKC/KEOPS complex subunit BUD32 n=1 Tax=Fusarium piperis TaxID=1435070 RepID=A0A9W8WEG6_9HYPO|nr:hypothetical protein N0V84_005035 [Fusarium piperis]